MVTIPTVGSLKTVDQLTGGESTPIDGGAETDHTTTGDLGRLGELYAALRNGAAPERIDSIGFHFTTQGSGDPLVTWAPPPIAPVANFGYAAAFTGGSQACYQRRVMPCASTRVYEVEADVEQVSVGGGESPVCRVGVHSLKSDYSDTSGAPEVYGAASAVLTAGQIVTVSYRFAAAAPASGAAWADPSTAIFVRPLVQVNQKSDLSGPCASSVARVRRLVLRDVTSQTSLDAPTITGSTKQNVQAVSALAIDWSKAEIQTKALSANGTFTFSGIAAGKAQVLILDLTISGGAVPTWPASVLWSGGTRPTLGNGRHLLCFITDDGGASVIGVPAATAVA